MGGSRHSKNAGTMGSEALTYAEKKALGYGTVRERLGKDAAGKFDDCRLTLQPAVDPVCTPQGIIYSREAIIESLLQQKKANKRKLAAWEAQQQQEQQKAHERESIAGQAALLAFDRQNHMGASKAAATNIQVALQEEAESLLSEKRVVAGAINITENKDKMKEMRAFWLPSKTPEAKDLMDKPDTATYCPATGKKLKLKDLVPVKFTRVREGDSGRYMDPITNDTFTNASKLVLLKPTGDVLLEETYKKCVKPEGRYNGVVVKERDVVKLETGGTGFAAHDGDKTQSQKFWALGPGSGKADLRGQHQGGPSRAGLVFWN